VKYLRSPLSQFLWNFIKELLSSSDPSRCKDFVHELLKCTCHVARVRSIAYAAGYCAYYARMIEKMGVFEVISSSISGKGKILHHILASATQRLFLNHTLGEIFETEEKLVKQAVDFAVEDLRPDIDEKVKNEAINMMRKLLNALSRAQIKGVISFDSNMKLFPIVEQEFIDFDDHMYGAPDLILEDLNGKKAFVVEWKSYEVGKGRWNDVDIAQVVAYAIMESRRLGIKELRNVLKAILGVDIDTMKRMEELVNKWKKIQENSPETIQIQRELYELVSKALDSAKKELRVLPLIISSSKSYPPHPIMYRGINKVVNHAKRFIKLYNMIKGVIIAAEHLTLQLTNAERVLAEIRGQSLNDIRNELYESCKSYEGYLAFNYTPCRFLHCGKPREQRTWPCRTRNGKLFCPFAGANEACNFYFGRREKEDFEVLMWRLRYKVFEEKEHSLANYKAMDILLRNFSLSWLFDDTIKNVCKGFVVDIAGETAHIERNKSVLFYVKIKRGGEELGKFRFDIITLNDVIVEDEEESLIVKRKLREIEIERGIIGTVKKSVVAYIVQPQLISPLLSINTFLMVKDSDLDKDEIIYYLYSPSVVLYNNLRLFKYYIENIRNNNAPARLLLFEAPANLTIMELRAIDVLHRYIATIKMGESMERMKIVNELGLSSNELDKEIELINEVLNESYAKKEELEGKSIPLYDILKKLLERSS